MLKRKCYNEIYEYLKNAPKSNKILVVDGARQVGKSYLIRHIGSSLFSNFIEINMESDKQHDRLFAEAKTKENFYLALSTIAGDKMGHREDTLIFIDEIQAYDHMLTLIKFLNEDARFCYIASGSLLDVALRNTQSIPIGSIHQLHMYPLDFEEFLWANDVGDLAINEMRKCFVNKNTLPEAVNNRIMGLFRRYLLVGGMPDAVNVFVSEHNIAKVRKVHSDIIDLYKIDASKYEDESLKRLKIRRIYEMIPSNMEKIRKRVVVKEIENRTNARTSDYDEEFNYLVSAGIALEADAISQPTYPLIQNSKKNLLKLYMNDVGLFTSLLYGLNIKPILDDIISINLGAVYETLVAQELKAHGFPLFYYDNKKIGEVDFIIDDMSTLSALPIEVKSGKDYTAHSALNRFISVKDYNVKEAYVLSNERKLYTKGAITYAPIYSIMFFNHDTYPSDSMLEI